MKADRKFPLTDPSRPVVNRPALDGINTLNDRIGRLQLISCIGDSGGGSGPTGWGSFEKFRRNQSATICGLADDDAGDAKDANSSTTT